MTLRIIAEAGVNFKNLDEARVFINRCKDLNMDYCKFQIYNDDNIKDNPNRKFLKSIMIGEKEAKKLVNYGKQIGQKIVFSAMYSQALQWYPELKCDFVKIRFKDRFEDWATYCHDNLVIVSVDQPHEHQIDLYPEATLKCVPEYPAHIIDYVFCPIEEYTGISDHTSDCTLLNYYIRYYNKYLCKFSMFRDFYFEKHVKLYDDCLESKWSVSFDELREVLGK